MHSTPRTLADSRFNVDVASGGNDYWKDLGGCREIGWRRETSEGCWYVLSCTYKKHPLIFHLRIHLVSPPTASISVTNSVSPTTAIPRISNATHSPSPRWQCPPNSIPESHPKCETHQCTRGDYAITPRLSAPSFPITCNLLRQVCAPYTALGFDTTTIPNLSSLYSYPHLSPSQGHNSQL